MPHRFVDLSHGIGPETPPFPGDSPVEILSSVLEASPGGARTINLGRITASLHCGTHMDAPFHFIDSGRTIDQVPLDQCIGPAVLVHWKCQGPDDRQIMKEDLVPYRDRLQETHKVVVNTGWHRRWGDPTYFQEHPAITAEAAQFLVECGVHLVGVDTPSVDYPPYDIHILLLGHGVVIVENLTQLDAIPAEVFQLVAIPLKITGRDGSPVRAIAMEL
ncbi:MAG: cyclase family protein [Candidatus Tectomicrobia bacterium]|uniref:Cyclase family protein n=1 Tax=Tectimicrobiota bacterium TaxID=2528274 RepID=A0A932CL43_UNCTE|nr:cyclase family protein [Candidatus Tectomicrobia bacterium]